VWRAEAAALNGEGLRLARASARAAARAAIAAELETHPPGGKPRTPDEIARAAAAAEGALSDAELEAEAGETADADPPALAAWPDALAPLSRYEASLERIIHRVKRDLEAAQKLRRAADAVALRATIAERTAERRRAILEAPPPLPPGFTLAGLKAQIAERSQSAPTPAPRAGSGPP
jgi:hypothetical protein